MTNTLSTSFHVSYKLFLPYYSKNFQWIHSRKRMLKYLPSNFFLCAHPMLIVHFQLVFCTPYHSFLPFNFHTLSVFLCLFAPLNVYFPLSLFTFLFISIYLPFSFSPLSFYLSLYSPFTLLSNYHFYYHAPNLPTFFLSCPDNKLISNFLNSLFLFH